MTEQSLNYEKCHSQGLACCSCVWQKILFDCLGNPIGWECTK